MRSLEIEVFKIINKDGPVYVLHIAYNRSGMRVLGFGMSPQMSFESNHLKINSRT